MLREKFKTLQELEDKGKLRLNCNNSETLIRLKSKLKYFYVYGNKHLFLLLVILFFSCKKNEIKSTHKNTSAQSIKDKKSQIDQSLINVSKWLIKDDSDSFKIVPLSFSFEQFYDDYVDEMTLSYYDISSDLKDYLIEHDFEAESYKCVLLPSPSFDKFSLVLALVVRGDSEYYILLSAFPDKIREMIVIGETGSVDYLITFDVTNDFIINKYKGQRDDKVLLEKLKITKEGEFINVKDKNTFIQGSTVYAQVKTYLNVRATPNANGNIIAKAYPKDGLKVLEVLDGWVKVTLNGKEGYVSKDFLK